MVDLILALLLSVAPAAPATPGGSPSAPPQPAPAATAVEEPAFQMPELVIIGENQARIMAQKEQMAGTPLRGLREAPLLEKEEGTVAVLRKREAAPRGAPPPARVAAVVKAEGGAPAWFAGSAWLGKLSPQGFLNLGLSGSRLEGPKVGLGKAGGWDTEVSAGCGFLFKDIGSVEAKLPGWTRRIFPVGFPDGGSMSLGWQEQSRDLPYVSAVARRKLSRFFLAGESSCSDTGWMKIGEAGFTRVRTPRGEFQGGFLGGSSRIPLWSGGTVAVGLKPRGEMEAADMTGDHVLLGTAVEASWIPGGRFRYLAGFSAEGVYGGGFHAGSVSPIGGVSWTSPSGPVVTASFSPSMRAHWFTDLRSGAAAASYSVFDGNLRPERELANAELAVRHQIWDGSEGRASYRFRESRSALSWREIPGQGLWAPVTLAELRVQELILGARYNGWRQLSVYGEGCWRDVESPSGEVANLPRGEGKAGVDWAWRKLTVGAEIKVARFRPRSDLPGPGQDLKPYTDMGVRVSYKPWSRAEIYLRGENLLGQTIEHWGGYPEPKRLAVLGALVSF